MTAFLCPSLSIHIRIAVIASTLHRTIHNTVQSTVHSIMVASIFGQILLCLTITAHAVV